MPYSTPVAYRVGNKLVIEIDLPRSVSVFSRKGPWVFKTFPP